MSGDEVDRARGFSEGCASFRGLELVVRRCGALCHIGVVKDNCVVLLAVERVVCLG